MAMKATKNNKTHLIFPRELLEIIDEFIGKRKRSKFVIEATREKLARERFFHALKEAAGAWKDKNHPGLQTKKDVERHIRGLRRSFRKRFEKIYA